MDVNIETGTTTADTRNSSRDVSECDVTCYLFTYAYPYISTKPEADQWISMDKRMQVNRYSHLVMSFLYFIATFMFIRCT